MRHELILFIKHYIRIRQMESEINIVKNNSSAVNEDSLEQSITITKRDIQPIYDNEIFKKVKYIKKLGVGAYSKVKKYSLPNGQFAAVKIFHPSDDGIEYSTLREIQILRMMRNTPNILNLLGVKMLVNKYGETCISVMVTCHSSDLLKFCHRVPFSERNIYADTIISQLLNGLYYLHESGIIHRDIKPANILVDYNYSIKDNNLSEPPICYIADFGLSRQITFEGGFQDDNLSAEVYTGLYRPPEIFTNHVDYTNKSDIWAMGLTIVEYFTQIPVLNNMASAMRQILALLTKSRRDTYSNKYRIEKYKLHDHIDHKKVMKQYLSVNEYKSISTDVSHLLSLMLQVNPNDRASINDIITFPNIPGISRNNKSPVRNEKELNIGKTVPKIYHVVPLGNIFINRNNEINSMMVHKLILWVIKASEVADLNIRTTVNCIDIVHRYISNYKVMPKKLLLLTIGCLSLSIKLMETSGYTFDDYLHICGYNYKVRELRKIELVIIKRMNYIISSCDIDEFVCKLCDVSDVYTTLTNIYKLIMANNVYAGKLSYHAMIEYLGKTQIT